ncbi:G-type lectin S-receptor-like serine/threonine-protein kinase LECRK1 [Castanea sativa]|uniref:G-type lectin S-receptor-like serine/threonine-protein kinase LECRK1 n=1 Tax=Castanea sativa TaxID=21020 RepID=UPI003F64979A
MATIFLFLLLSAIFTAEAQTGQSSIEPGSFLTATLTTTTNSSWLSPSALYAFGFYKQGNGYSVGIFVEGIPQKTVVWTANRDDPPVPADAILNFTSDGQLVLQSAQQGTNKSILESPGGATSASMLDSGNFVLYNSNNNTIWQSFNHSTDTLLPSQQLLVQSLLKSSVSDSNHSTGRFLLLMQQDGYLAMYPVGTPYTIEYGYWNYEIHGETDNAKLNLDDNGHLYLDSINGTAGMVDIHLGDNSTKGFLYLLRIDADGILRLYSHNMDQNGTWSVTWSQPDDKCAPKGLCGLNAYCVKTNQSFDCNCLPGFARINQSEMSSGCERNFTAESCKASMTYTMEAVNNTIWEYKNISVLSSSTQEACKAACLQDCKCEAALFKDGECKTQSLPFRFLTLRQGDSNVALIKVGISTPTTDGNVSKKSKKEVIIISVSLVAFAIVLVISGVVMYRYRVWACKKESYQFIHKKKKSNLGNIVLSEEVSLRSFTYAELEQVTDNFKEELGRGSFGIVYKGAIGDGKKLIAVKRLDKLLADREREFQTEMKVIGRTHHKNLVQLLGYCHDGPNRLLVYEFMSNGSLADILFTPEKQPCWDERMEIARNIARGILYLHEECMPQIIHCDIKPQNILMDENMCAKISDFGLSKLLKPDETKTFTDIRGTRGYVAPEWHRKMSVTVKVDVYSFGIVLLEIICCRKCVDYNVAEEEAILEEWAYHCFECGELGKLVNEEEVDKKQLERITKVALWCILYEPSLRPSMKKVLLMLEETLDIPDPPSRSIPPSVWDNE